MIVVIGEIRVTAGAVDVVRDAIGKMESETLKEPGCRTYAFSLDICDPTMVRIIERWDSVDDLKAHFGTPHMAEFNGAIGALGIQSMNIDAYELGESVALPI